MAIIYNKKIKRSGNKLHDFTQMTPWKSIALNPYKWHNIRIDDYFPSHKIALNKKEITNLFSNEERLLGIPLENWT